MIHYRHLLFLITIFCWSMYSCSQHDSATIEGRIDPVLVKKQKVYFYVYPDSLSRLFLKNTVLDSCMVKADGSFSFRIEKWKKPAFFDLGNGDFIFARGYFLEPGNKLNLVFNGKEVPPKLMISEQCGKYNVFVQSFLDTFYRDPLLKEMYYITSNYMPAKDYATYINKRRVGLLSKLF